MTSSSLHRPAGRQTADTRREQEHLDLVHHQIAVQRAEIDRELRAVLREPAGTAQGQVERGTAAARLARHLAALDAAENGLCFGRLDRTVGDRLYVGRIGVPGVGPDDDPLLVDWRAPAARPFYTATAAAPQGVRLRRHLHTRNRRVLRVDDELFADLSAVPDDTRLSGEAALLAALRQSRTGRMQDAVATLQAEQDRIIRSPHTGVMVVQGGPGTGKTVVALHRAAYLLYTHPRLERSGVLVVGPNSVFLDYIGQVLPGLGETSVLLSSVGGLYPGLLARAEEPPAVAEIKGRLAMAEVLERAVRARQAAVTGPVDVAIGGELVRLTRRFLTDAADRATEGGVPHNLARPAFREAVLDELADRLARVIGDIEAGFEEVLADQVDVAALERAVQQDLAGVFGDDASVYDLRAQEPVEFAERKADWLEMLPRDPVARKLMDLLWPVLTPQRLLTELFTDPDRLAEAAPCLTEAERALLLRRPDAPWTLSDVPLLDEAAELLGSDDRVETERETARRDARQDYAQGVLDIARASRGDDGPAEGDERLNAADLVTAEQLAAWHTGADLRTVAERAAADRSWTFGHVIVDEAQDVSPMTWRLLVRRCPTRSFTVVGDAAQSSDAAGSTSWQEALSPFFGTRWRREELTVNYRTPAEIVVAAAPVLAAIAPDLAPARAVRDGAAPPCREGTTAEDFPARLAAVTAEAAAACAGDGGRVAVIVPSADLDRLAPAVAEAVPGTSWGADADLEQPVVVLTVRQAKGLEFDSVVVADPQGMLDGSARGLSDLYVALTRAGRSLHVLHPGPVPPVLEDLPVHATT
ncbi:ATP-binding domain-containing protein [Streptomyces sp. WAC06614]|uniref:HelD family protein n=1 Tax=Streptomyces sp. WAC06614 TaxID=2487416 RepID=UPI000F7BA84A|nr:ATP-binding domain-containing protein [Streptomyces sp. WAC06614]RSS82236.1 helicase [Streptomyces sp. WAC06614]